MTSTFTLNPTNLIPLHAEGENSLKLLFAKLLSICIQFMTHKHRLKDKLKNIRGEKGYREKKTVLFIDYAMRSDASSPEYK